MCQRSEVPPKSAPLSREQILAALREILAPLDALSDIRAAAEGGDDESEDFSLSAWDEDMTASLEDMRFEVADLVRVANGGR